jgi:hypothetical protein
MATSLSNRNRMVARKAPRSPTMFLSTRMARGLPKGITELKEMRLRRRGMLDTTH